MELCSVKNCKTFDDSAENISKLDREMYHRKLILVTKTYNKRMCRHIECVDIHGVHAEKV